MSANLWEAKNVTPYENPEDGIYACSGTQGVRTNVALDRLAENQVFHCGFSVNPGKDDKFNMTLCYRDAAGSVNYANTAGVSVPAGKWTRVSGSVVIPSGMTVYQLVICNNNNASGASGWKVTNPTLSLGSPVVLASSAHTPYATQDHLRSEYATKATLTTTADGIRGEVARKVSVGSGGTVTDLSSVMEQSADGVLFKFSKTVGGATYQPAIELTTDTDYDDGRTVNSAIKMWESMSARAGGGDPVTEINGSTMRINKVVLVESLRVGGWVLRAVSDSSDGSELIEIRSV